MPMTASPLTVISSKRGFGASDGSGVTGGSATAVVIGGGTGGGSMAAVAGAVTGVGAPDADDSGIAGADVCRARDSAGVRSLMGSGRAALTAGDVTVAGPE